jgi:hypothetical protein
VVVAPPELTAAVAAAAEAILKNASVPQTI